MYVLVWSSCNITVLNTIEYYWILFSYQVIICATASPVRSPAPPLSPFFNRASESPSFWPTPQKGCKSPTTSLTGWTPHLAKSKGGLLSPWYRGGLQADCDRGWCWCCCPLAVSPSTRSSSPSSSRAGGGRWLGSGDQRRRPGLQPCTWPLLRPPEAPTHLF